MKTPLGKLIPIGGKEAKEQDDSSASPQANSIDFFESGILEEVLNEIKGLDSRIGIVATASSDVEDMESTYLKAFGKLGCTNVMAFSIHDRRQVDSQKTLELLAEVDGVFFTGGDQNKLAHVFNDSEFLKLLRHRYLHDEHFTVVGTSAGAMAMSEHMIEEGDSTESVLKGLVKTAKGFSLLPEAIVDTHFMTRGRLSRLIEALLRYPGCVALGICEDTGLVISGGNLLRPIGSGVVVVLEADQVRQTNYQEARKGDPIFIENLRLHTLAKNATYSLLEKRFIEAVAA